MMMEHLMHFRASEHAFVKRVCELAERAVRAHTPIYTDFLTPREAGIGQMAAVRANVNWFTFGGYRDAERQRGCFHALPDVTVDSSAFGIACVSANCSKGAPVPKHGDFLGALLGLGLKRHLLGDIVSSDRGAYVFCTESSLPILLHEWKQASRVDLKVEQVTDLDRLTFLRLQLEERVVTLQSLRLDAVVGHAFGLSRARAVEPIKAGRVQLNFAVCTDPAEEIHSCDMISLRGSGRAQVMEISGQSRSGRTFVRIGRYI